MELNLVKIDPPGRRRWFSVLLSPLASELKLRHGTLDEIREKTSDPNRLVRRHGLARVLAFYEQKLLPALRRLPDSQEVWRARFEVGCQAVQMLAHSRPPRNVERLAAALNAGLTKAHFSDDPKADGEVRLQVRNFLAKHLTSVANWMAEHGAAEEAVQANEMVEQLGCMDSARRPSYVSLLWRERQHGPSAMMAYLRFFSEQGWSAVADPQLGGLVEFVSDQLAVGEELPTERGEIARRLLFNQYALCGLKPPPVSFRYAGLAYLRLDQPERALDYLNRAQALDGSDGGLTSFYLGQALFQVGKFKEAADAFEQSVSSGGSRSRVASWQGLAYAKQRQWDKALQTFGAADEDGENLDGEFYLQWGRASFLMGDAAGAEQKFRRALEAGTADPRAPYGLAVCLVREGRRAEAVELLRGAVSAADEFAPAFHLLGRLLQEAGEAAEALPCLARAVALCPGDAEYSLSLGLALDDADDPEGTSYLRRAAEAGVGGPEVVRRVALGHFRRGEREAARRWLNALEPDAAPSVALFRERDRVTQATDAFNTGRFDEAAALWARAHDAFGNDPRTRSRLALSLLFDAVSCLRRGVTEGVAERVERAHELDPCPAVRFMYGFVRMAGGDSDAARRTFAALSEESPDDPGPQFFECLAGFFAGDEVALEKLSRLGPVAADSDLNSLLAFLQVWSAALRGAFEEAAEKVGAWAKDSAAVKSLGLPRYQINIISALCLIRGTRQRRQRVVSLFKELNAAYGDGFWNLALTLAKHHVAAPAGAALSAAQVETLGECEAAYRELLAAAETGERQPILERLGELLRCVLCHRVGVSDVGGALEVISQIRDLPPPVPPEIETLRGLLEERMHRPSHEKAYALLSTDPDAAREVWRDLLAADPLDFVALQHLACLAWSRAFDEVLAGRHEASLPFWEEGLEWHRQLFELSDFWEHLREKGRALGMMPGHPFDEQLFETWRADAAYETARTILDLIFSLLAGTDPAKKRDKETEARVRLARELMQTVRRSKFPD